MGRRFCLDGDDDDVADEGNPVRFHKCHHGGGNQVLLSGVVVCFGSTTYLTFLASVCGMSFTLCSILCFSFHRHGILISSLESYSVFFFIYVRKSNTFSG